MTIPIPIQTIKRTQVSPGNEYIKNRHTKIPKIGTKGTNGVLNERGALGWVLRRINTPTHTNTKANKVPILVISPTMETGTKAANTLTNTANNKLDL